MNRLIVPPLPAASRPSNKIRCFEPVSCDQSWNFSSSGVLLVLVQVTLHPLLVGVVRAPGLHRIATWVYEVRVRSVFVVADAVTLTQNVREILAEVFNNHLSAPYLGPTGFTSP